MNLFSLSWKNLRAKPLDTALCLLLFALGTGLISLMLLASSQVRQRLERNLDGVDLVVGAKGSRLQMVLSSVYHIDRPTGNMPLADAQNLSRIKSGMVKLVQKVIPQALGDNYKNYRIVGTTPDYPTLYGAELERGEWWKNDMEATIGADVALRTGLQIGSFFKGSHGIDAETDSTGAPTDSSLHKEIPYVVTGIMQYSGTVMDQLVLTNVSSVWNIHGHAEPADSAVVDSAAAHAHHHAHTWEDLMKVPAEGRELTTCLITYPITKRLDPETGDTLREPSTMADFILTSKILPDFYQNLGHANPTRETVYLLENIGLGLNILYWLAAVFVLVSGLSVFISLYNSLKERRYEIALMRVMGASAGKIFFLVVLEGMLLSCLGCLLGLLLSHGGMAVLSATLQNNYRYRFEGFGYFLPEELYLVVGALFVGFLASLLPAFQAYRTRISTTLAGN
jgi:putative ABC transport system permease protein